MKKVLAIIISLVVSFSLCACGENKEDVVDQVFKDSYDSKTLMSFLKDTNDNPKILYFVDKISKDSNVTEAYVFKDEKCRKYHCEYTLGDLSKLTDLEIIKALDKQYEKNLAVEKENWLSDEVTFNEMLNGNIKLYEPVYYDFYGLLFTDDSGNYVKNEMLVLPKAGIGDSPYVIYYPDPEYEESMFYFNYHNSSYDKSSYRKIKFDEQFFYTGYGKKSDFNKITDAFCISNRGIITGNVYESLYYGFDCSSNEWASNDGILCFRNENSNVLDIWLDDVSSDNITCVDPDEEEISTIKSDFYFDYYNSFNIIIKP